MPTRKDLQRRELGGTTTVRYEAVEPGVTAPATEAPLLSMRMDYSGANLIYLGRAAIGSATSAAVWQIRKFAYDGSGNLTGQTWADGDTEFDNVWDSRASLSYS